MAKISHPNVAQVFEVGEWRERIYLAMEFIEGRTLGDWLEAEARSRDEVIPVLLQAGEGLAAAHGSGVIHRDFKPDNILVGDDSHPRIRTAFMAASAAALPLAALTGLCTWVLMDPLMASLMGWLLLTSTVTVSIGVGMSLDHATR